MIAWRGGISAWRGLFATAALQVLACGGSKAVGGASPPAPSAPIAVAGARSDGGAAADASGSKRPTREERLIARMLKRVSAARGIASRTPVPGIVLPRDELIAKVKDHVNREIPPEAIRNEGLVLQLLGFVPTTFDYEAAEYALLEAQLAGYYEPADQTMYMAADLEDDDADATLAHELVHALQDSRWDLKTRSKYRPGAGDRSTAVSALAEGDATSAMFDVMLEKKGMHGKTALDLPEEVFSKMITEGMNSGPTAASPHVMRTSLAAPYIYGTLFVHALRRRGGWDTVNRAWDDPPSTSEQVMHLDKYDAREPELVVPAPPATTLGVGWATADTDVYGELGARLAFEEWMDEDQAAAIAAHWGGDEGVLMRSGDGAAFAWRLRYDDARVGARDSFARNAFDGVGRALRRRFGNPSSKDGAAFVCYERSDRGPLAVARADKDLVFVAGPAKASAPAWSAAGDCALAKKWTAEITSK